MTALKAHETLISREGENPPSSPGWLKEEDKTYLKGHLADLVPGFGVMLVAWLIMWLSGRVAFVIAGAVLFTAALDAYKVWTGALERDPLRLLRSAGGSFAALWIISWLNVWLGGWGLLGVVLLSICLGLWVLYKRRHAYMAALRHIERRFFGMTMEERREQKRREKNE